MNNIVKYSGICLSAAGIIALIRSSSDSGKYGFYPLMTKEEARSILNIPKDATPFQIKSAHKKLLMANHPDREGSTYVTSKINDAKSTLES